ncbi:MAG: PEGA domain-containing protein [Persicimonas sp.]
MSTSFSTNIYRMGRRFSAALVALVILGAGLGQARADAPSKEDLRTFKKLVKEGSELRDQGESFEAIETFEQAREYLDHPKLVFNIGKLKEKTGACEAARDLYTEALGREKLADDLRVEVAEKLKTSKSCTPFGTLSIECKPDGATIEMGRHEFSCPATKRIEPGEYEAVVRAPEYRETTVAVEVTPGARLERAVELEPAGPDDEVAAGRQVQDPSEPAAADGATPWMRYTAWGAMGVGAGLLGAGLISDYGAQSRQEEFLLANEAGDRDRAGQLEQDADAAQMRTIVFYSAGAVLAVGGVVLWTLDSRQSDDTGARVRAEFGWDADAPAVRGVLTW